MSRLTINFFEQDVLEVAPGLLGKVWVIGQRKEPVNLRIIETEAYRGEEDLACHARVGRTGRTEVMYGPAGRVYLYLIYGMYWMMNIVTGRVGEPQAVLIRGVEVGQERVIGPGKITKRWQVDSRYKGEDLVESGRMWIETVDGKEKEKVWVGRRVGVEYAGEWAEKLWRFGIG